MADPRVVRYQSAIASSYNAIAMIQVQLGRSAEAVRTFEQFRDRMQAILADDPRNYDARIWLSSALHNLGEAQVELGRPAEAVRTFQGAIEQKHLIQAAGHDFKPIRRALGHHYQGLAGAQRRWAGRPRRRRPCWSTRTSSPATRPSSTTWPADSRCASRSSARAAAN